AAWTVRARPFTASMLSLAAIPALAAALPGTTASTAIGPSKPKIAGRPLRTAGSYWSIAWITRPGVGARSLQMGALAVASRQAIVASRRSASRIAPNSAASSVSMAEADAATGTERTGAAAGAWGGTANRKADRAITADDRMKGRDIAHGATRSGDEP